MPISLPSDVLEILRRLTERGFSAYIVGGCVRDVLRGRTPHDWDVCTSATPDEMQACFTGFRTIPTGLKHGTLTILLHGAPYEITTFRRDGAYADHRHPVSVAFTDDVITDLRRRDFTINSMAYHPDTGLIDPFHGEDDLRAGVLRSVGDPDARFREDALRILRAMRFSSTLGFRIDAATEKSMRLLASSIALIAPERIAMEINALLLGQNAGAALSRYADILSACIPEILPCVDFDQRSKYHHLTVWEHTCLSVQNAPQTLSVRLALLLHDIGKPSCFSIGMDGYGHFYGHPAVSADMARAILTHLRYDTAMLQCVTTLVLHHDAPLTATKPAVRRWLNRLGADMLRLLLDVKRADAGAHIDPAPAYARIQAFSDLLTEVLNAKDCFTLHNLAIGGKELLQIGIPQSPAIGAILAQLLDEVIDEELENTRDALLSRARALASANCAADTDSFT